MQLETIALELASICKKLGMRRNDSLALRKIVEQLSIKDSQLPTDQQKGYAQIVRSYKPTGWTRLHNMVLKHWTLEEPAIQQPAPQIPSQEENVEESTCHSFLLTLATGSSDMLKICQYVTGHVSNILGKPVSISSVSKQSETDYDFLICGPVNPMNVLDILSGISGVQRCLLRSKFDYESAEIETPLLEWDVPTFVPLEHSHAATQDQLQYQ